ncbi:MAG: hypothetical protein A2Y98_03485 [Candidatus Portnoybacteria bacterium RBG_19FT_COMBO_36_7]|uniref:Uncharacterized protein n=1 Tax=Candidatus Portnoybacteria bacterium RBG_19FT_COMBO_36_7 TaxID=1801992 RepID=A0A1G2F7X0_9BACT|nr:MAG: hypothetical protein A2Y98_03485 [Candidatus Portnoybacteria bacterium RBG_19FT_COMBO_36_7]
MRLSKESLVVISCLGALALVAAIFIMPAFDSVKASKQTISDNQAVLEEAELFNQKIAGFNSQYKKDELERLLSVLPKQEELPVLLIQLEGLATSNGLIMESVDFSKIEDNSKNLQSRSSFESEDGLSAESVVLSQKSKAQLYKILLVSLKLNGGYNEFKNYLKAVEKNSRLMDVISLSMGGSSRISQSYTFSVNLQVYYQ